jgi:hypothetical protein
MRVFWLAVAVIVGCGHSVASTEEAADERTVAQPLDEWTDADVRVFWP